MAAAKSNSSTSPEELQKLIQKYERLKFFVAQYAEEVDLLEKVKEACSDLCAHKEKAKHLSLYGPGQPSQIQLKLDLNEWMSAQNNAMAKQDIVEVILQDYKRQMQSYEKDILRRGGRLLSPNADNRSESAASTTTDGHLEDSTGGSEGGRSAHAL